MIKFIISFLALFLCVTSNAQESFNIGSTSNHVKKVMGFPKSVTMHEPLKEEIWTYGQYNMSTVTFKNDKVIGYNNHKGVLKIGEAVEDERQPSNDSSRNVLNLTEEDLGMNKEEFEKIQTRPISSYSDKSNPNSKKSGWLQNLDIKWILFAFILFSFMLYFLFNRKK